MFHPKEIFIGLRYTRSKRSNHFVSFISVSSILGMAVGITALITVMSVMNGAIEQFRDSTLSMTSHATVLEYGGKLADWPGTQARVAGQPHVVDSSPFVNGEGMLSNGSQVSGAMIQGIVPVEEKGTSLIAEKMVQGSLDDLKPGDFNIVIGRTLANILSVNVGDKVTVITPQANVTPAGIVPRLKRFTVVGLFNANFYQFDRGLVLVHMADAQRLLRMGEDVSGLRLKLDDIFAAPQISREMNAALGGNYVVRNWTEEYASYYQAVQIEKTAMFVILTLIVAVAAFNIVSTMVMVVADKQADIAILRTLGASPLSIMGVFMVQGLVIGVVGTVLGLAGGVSLAKNLDTVVPWIENLTGTQFMPPEVYQISGVPSQLLWGDVLVVGIVAFFLAIVATLYPAWRASRTQPAEALRYE